MQTDSRALAHRHMWLSWWWGVGLVWIAVVGWLLFWVEKKISASEGLISILRYVSGNLALGVLGTMLFLGVPALLGALVRRPFMRRVFSSTTSPARLLLRTALVFEGFALLCWVLWELLIFCTEPLAFKILPPQHLQSTVPAFFGLSLPWLLSSGATAWWVTRPAAASRPK
ncbi:hypothetical protein [Hymenobacter sp. APR13]|uniref:hypothetical protein n=1 Tax=Hymenobacter sp. APR13 TaxID=1356852 RepID=UPI0004E07D5D|nr:hypothetical protein [Hymenobacter sp. APR13]AII52837.1 hypothetical protein N008_12730 [Hymenobacter sp. APR13]